MMTQEQAAVRAGLMTAASANEIIARTYGEQFETVNAQHATVAKVSRLLHVWANRYWIVALMEHIASGQLRLSINRNEITSEGHWRDGVTWDELMQVKRDVGYGDTWAVECYPSDDEVVNMANQRHLVLLNESPSYAWDKNEYILKSAQNGFPVQEQNK